MDRQELPAGDAGDRATGALVDGAQQAPLDPTSAPMGERCGKCRECVDICPVGAFTGRSFADGEPREIRYQAHACQRYFAELAEAGGPPVCGLCLYVCPYGRDRTKPGSQAS